MTTLESRAQAPAPGAAPARPRSLEPADALRRHWPEYAIEAALLGGFMISACVFTMLLEHPSSPLRQSLPGALARRALMGLAMGATAVAIIYSPWGQRSGAHVNPATTLTFFRLGKVDATDAALYALSQFAGALAGIGLMALLLPGAVRHPAVNFAATLPGPAGVALAFAAEVAITFLLITVVLTITNEPRWNRYAGLAVGACVALFITFEAPLSGMSMNPARTLGSAAGAMRWEHLWIYFVAPPLGMLLAAELRLRARGVHSILCAKFHHENDRRCIFRCGYPVCGPPLSTKGAHGVKTHHYDVIIIGTGAGGGTILWSLASTGKRILVLERGDFVPREKDNWSSKAVNVDGKYQTKEVWRDVDGKPLHPHTNYYVGGNTKFYGAALFRLRKEDFGEIRHHGGMSPAWPIAYDELEPYYTAAERLYNVHGTRGEDPTDPPASAPYPAPAVSHEPRIQHLAEDFAQHGLHPFHVPLGIALNEKDKGLSKCIRCESCDGFPCLVQAKSDSHVCCVEPALARENVTLLTNAKVTRLHTDASGRTVTKIAVERNGGTPEEYSADMVVLSAGAINSAALLLKSANEKHPRGLANGSDVVGRHYMGHVNSVVLAVSKCPNPTVFQKTLAVNDFYFASKEWEYPMGHISFVGKLDGVALSAGAPAIAPGFTLDLMAKHSLDFWLTSEDLPDPKNRVTLDRDGNIVLKYQPNNVESHKRLRATLQKYMNKQRSCTMHGDACHVGIFGRNLFIGEQIPLAGVAHQNGTVRFGRDAKTSALDTNCKAHELDNLYVVDGSFFPSSAAVNPALTIMANALRVGEHLKERLQ